MIQSVEAKRSARVKKHLDDMVNSMISKIFKIWVFFLLETNRRS
jgi:hypothetical protein